MCLEFNLNLKYKSKSSFKLLLLLSLHLPPGDITSAILASFLLQNYSFDFSFDSGDQIGTHFRHIMHLCGKFCYRRDFHYVPCRRQSRRPTVANNGAYWFN